jgi:Zn-dependent peptidase ImmA (M78 family)
MYKNESYSDVLGDSLRYTIGEKGTVVDLDKISKSIGIEILEENFDTKLVAGKIINDNGNVKILVNRDDNKKNQRFNTAKMIGWSLLNTGKDKVFLKESNPFIDIDDESRVLNSFASSLLIDEKSLVNYVKAIIPTDFESFFKRDKEKYLSSKTGSSMTVTTTYPREYIIKNLSTMFDVESGAIEYKLSTMR